jgi:DnaJ-class molecular chaperone
MATSTRRDFYNILGVSRTASDKDIKTAYRKLARKYHPDLNQGDKTAEARFKEIQAAYEVLGDPEKRKKYDQFGENWDRVDQARGGFGTGGFGTQDPGGVHFDFGNGADFSDILENLFGGLGGNTRNRTTFRTRTRKGEDVEHPLEVSLEEAYFGATRVLEVPSSTGGSRRLEVRIPPGVKTGSRVRLAGEGHPGVGGAPAGDMYLVLTVRPHVLFERKDDDLSCEVSLPLTTALLGGEVQVPTLKSKVHLRIPPETQNGQVFRLAGQGMPRSTGSGNGDLFARMKVVLPTRLSPREKELFQELAKLRANP